MNYCVLTGIKEEHLGDITIKALNKEIEKMN